MEEGEIKNEGVSPRKNNTYPDPTYNVLQLVNAAVQRLDDIMKLNKEIMDLHVSYGDKLARMEEKRLDSIRNVDVSAVAREASRADQQAAVLANQVAVSADTLRNLVASTAKAVNDQFQQVTSQLIEKISSLEKAQYEGIGKGRVSDPIMTDLLAEVKSLRESRSTSTGKSAGISMVTGLLITIGFMVVALVGLAIKVFGG